MALTLGDIATGNAVPGGLSSVTGVDPAFAAQILKMYQAMPPELQARFRIISGFRDAARQAQVNPGVTNSRHMHGYAVDTQKDPAVQNWINQNGGQFDVGYAIRHLPGEENHLEYTPGGRRMGVGGSHYAQTGDPQFGSGLKTSQEPQDFGGAPDESTAAAAVPTAKDNRALFAALALQSAAPPGGPLAGPSSLADALTRGLQPVAPEPAPLIPTQQALIGSPLALARRIG